MIRSCYINNFAYGSGQDLVYDYPRIQVNIVSGFMNKKKLRADNLEFIQY